MAQVAKPRLDSNYSIETLVEVINQIYDTCSNESNSVSPKFSTNQSNIHINHDTDSIFDNSEIVNYVAPTKILASNSTVTLPHDTENSIFLSNQLPDNATVWELVKAQIESDLRIFHFFIPNSIKAFVRQKYLSYYKSFNNLSNLTKTLLSSNARNHKIHLQSILASHLNESTTFVLKVLSGAFSSMIPKLAQTEQKRNEFNTWFCAQLNSWKKPTSKVHIESVDNMYNLKPAAPDNKISTRNDLEDVSTFPNANAQLDSTQELQDSDSSNTTAISSGACTDEGGSSVVDYSVDEKDSEVIIEI